jgi:ABC-type multidrug transport system ATPase subunit
LDIGPGFTLLLGPNGSGKSSLLKLMAGVEAPAAGSVVVDGKDLWRDERAARRKLAYVPEQPDLSPYAALGEAMRLVCALRDVPPAAGDGALERVGLGDLRRRSVRELSMGQRRRAMLAAAFIGTPDTLLLDEPLESLDRGMRESVVAWLAERVAGGACAVVSTHEIEPFLSLATGAIVMSGGEPRVETLHDDAAARLAQCDGWARGT